MILVIQSNILKGGEKVVEVKKDRRKNLKISEGCLYSLKELAVTRKESMHATLMWLVNEALWKEKKRDKDNK